MGEDKKKVRRVKKEKEKENGKIRGREGKLRVERIERERHDRTR